MSARMFWRIMIVGVFAAGLAACNDQGQTNAPDGDVDAGAQGIEAGDDATTGDDGAAGVEVEATSEGRISSGAIKLGPTKTPPVRPEAPAGVRRIVRLEEAVAGATFTVLEPKVLPEETHRDVVHLESLQEGEINSALPAVRFVYTLGAGGALVLYQHAATGEEGPGEAVDINGNNGWALEDGAPIVTWEQDGVRLELRGETDLETLLAAARSVGPVDTDG